MNDHIRGALAILAEKLDQYREEQQAGFARLDRYLELHQLQLIEFRTEVRGRLDDLTERVERLEDGIRGVDGRLESLRSEVISLRDWTAREFAEVRVELRVLRQRHELENPPTRGEVDALEARVTRLEQRLRD